MTAALRCFDTERHEQSLFPSLFSSGTGIPLLPLLSVAHPPPLHFLSLLGCVHSGPHRGPRYARLTGSSHSPSALRPSKHIVFALREMPEVGFFHGAQQRGGQSGLMLNAGGGSGERWLPFWPGFSQEGQWDERYLCFTLLGGGRLCDVTQATS